MNRISREREHNDESILKKIKESIKKIKGKKLIKSIFKIIAIATLLFVIINNEGLVYFLYSSTKRIWDFAKIGLWHFLNYLLLISILIYAFCKVIYDQIKKLNKIDRLSDRMVEFGKSLEEVQHIIKEVDTDSLELMKTSCSILSDAVNLSINPEIIDRERKL